MRPRWKCETLLAEHHLVRAWSALADVRGFVLRLRVRHRPEFAIRPRLLPELERDRKRVNVESAPPCRLVARAMQLAVMDPANRDRELVAHASPECTRLCKREVMRSDGTRPHTRQGCRSTNLRCSLSRSRTGLPNAWTTSLRDGFLARRAPLWAAPSGRRRPRVRLGPRRQVGQRRPGDRYASGEVWEPSEASPSLILESLA